MDLSPRIVPVARDIAHTHEVLMRMHLTRTVCAQGERLVRQIDAGIPKLERALRISLSTLTLFDAANDRSGPARA